MGWNTYTEGGRQMSELKDIRRWKWSDRGFLELDNNGNLCELDDVKIIVRHHKYKRCLAMASKCRLRARWFGDNAFYKKEQWALNWHRCWLELAEKFKEVK